MKVSAIKSRLSLANRGSFKEVGLIGLCWMVHFSITMIYCIAYERFVNNTSPQLFTDVIWFIQEWGLWIILTPFIFANLRYIEHSKTLTGFDLLTLGGAAFFLTLSYRTWLDLYLDTANSLIESVILHGPRYVFASIIIIGMWLVFIKKKKQTVKPTEDTIESTILVHKGSDKCLINYEQIEFACAAKNYVELHCANNTYLVRSTIKQLEALLPIDKFMRIHRSVIIKTQCIERIKSLPSGSGTIILSNGKSVPISKRYLAQLRKSQTSRA